LSLQFLYGAARVVTRGGKVGTISWAPNRYGNAESLRGAPNDYYGPRRCLNNVKSTLFGTVLLLPEDLRFEHGGAIQPRSAPRCSNC